MKKLGLILALTVAGATSASAQSIQFRLGPDVDRYDRYDRRDRVIVRERSPVVRFRDVDRTGSVCRETVTYRINKNGQRVKSTIRDCD